MPRTIFNKLEQVNELTDEELLQVVRSGAIFLPHMTQHDWNAVVDRLLHAILQEKK